MKNGLVFILFFLTGLVYSQMKNEKPHYFFTIVYGQNNEVFVSDIYERNIEQKEIYGKLAERYVIFQNYLVKTG